MAFGQMAPGRLPTDIKRYYEGGLWSTYYFADGAALANVTAGLFTTPQNATGQGFPTPLSLSETNLAESNRIAAGLAFTVRSLAIEPHYDDNYPMVRADLQNLQAYCVPQWSFLNTTIDVAPVSLVGQGGGIFGSTADTGAVEGGQGGSRIILNNGAGQSWVYGELPILLAPNTTFTLNLKFGSGARVVDGGTNNSNLLVRGTLLGVITSAVPVG